MSKTHLLVRFAAPHQHDDPNEPCDFDAPMAMYEALIDRTFAWVDRADTVEVFALADQGIDADSSLVGSSVLVGDNEVERRIREGVSSPPALAIDPRLAHRLAETPPEDVEDYLAKLGRLLEQASTVGVHYVLGISYVFPEQGKAAWDALPAGVIDQFHRVTVTEEDPSGVAITTALSLITGIEVDMTAVGSTLACANCGSVNLAWKDMVDVRTQFPDAWATIAANISAYDVDPESVSAMAKCGDCNVFGIAIHGHMVII